MGFPPPPHDGPPQPPEQGGGFGPPQGFGPPPPPGDGFGPPPPPPPADGYGYPQQGGGYGPPGPPGPPVPPGGYGYPGAGYPGGGYPPPQPPPNHTKRNVWIAVGAVVVVGAIVGAIAVSSGGGDDKPSAKNSTKPPSLTAMPTMPTVPTPSFTLPTDFPSLDLPTDFPSSSDDPEPSSTDGSEVPYVVVDPGKCFNAPSMTHTISTVQTVSCSSAHDAQSIANKTLSGSFTSDDDIQEKAFSLCEADANKHAPAGGDYYEYVLYPQLITYQLQGRKTVTCALTLNDGSNNKKLHSKLS